MGIQSLNNRGGNAIDVTRLNPVSADSVTATGTGTYQTILSITGKGFLESFYAYQGTAGVGFLLRVTIDGSIKILLGNSLASKPLGVINKTDLRPATASSSGIPTPNSLTFAAGTLTPTAIKPYPTIDSSDGLMVLGNEKIYFKNSLILEISSASGVGYAYRYDGGYM